MKNIDEQNWLSKIASAGDLKTPFVLTDTDIPARKAERFKELMPRIGIYYALKSNNDVELLRALDEHIEGYDIASLGEFRQLQKLGVSPNRIVYSNPVKIPSHIEETFKGGVTHFALDSVNEVLKIQQYAPGATVYLRVKVSDYGSKFPLSSKFGLDPLHVVACASAAQEAGLQVKGITFHVGSQAESPKVWEAAIKVAGKLIGELRQAGIPIEFLDLGGGFPASYDDLAPTIVDAAKVINKAIDTHLPEDIRLFAEPGRYISANSSIMGASVIGREFRSGAEWLYLDLGVFQGLIEPLEMAGWKYPLFTEKSPRGFKKSFVLSGPTCDAYDTLGLDYSLPSDLNVGDKIYIGSAGAYTLVYASNFNGFEPPKTYYVKRKV